MIKLNSVNFSFLNTNIGNDNPFTAFINDHSHDCQHSVIIEKYPTTCADAECYPLLEDVPTKRNLLSDSNDLVIRQQMTVIFFCCIQCFFFLTK